MSSDYTADYPNAVPSNTPTRRNRYLRRDRAKDDVTIAVNVRGEVIEYTTDRNRTLKQLLSELSALTGAGVRSVHLKASVRPSQAGTLQLHSTPEVQGSEPLAH